MNEPVRNVPSWRFISYDIPFLIAQEKRDIIGLLKKEYVYADSITGTAKKIKIEFLRWFRQILTNLPGRKISNNPDYNIYDIIQIHNRESKYSYDKTNQNFKNPKEKHHVMISEQIEIYYLIEKCRAKNNQRQRRSPIITERIFRYHSQNTSA